MYHGFYGLYGLYGLLFGFWWPAAVVAVIPFWRICVRIGYSPWLSLLVLVPLVNLIFVYFIAFSQWPARDGVAGPGGSGAGPGTAAGGSGPTGS